MSEIHTSALPGVRLSYSKDGTGKMPLLLFHGFGQDHAGFGNFFAHLSTPYTLYAFDLFFHGRSKWKPGGSPIQKQEWKALLQQFLDENKIERFCLLGFSLGARFALASLEAFPEKTVRIFLIAPDGIRISPWYTLATSTSLMRYFFKGMITRQHRFNSLVRWACSLGFINKVMRRFVESQMNQEEKRQRVYDSWVTFRKLKFNLAALAELMNLHGINLEVFCGKRDSLITADHVKKFLGKINHGRLHILESGHVGLPEEAGKILDKFSP